LENWDLFGIWDLVIGICSWSQVAFITRLQMILAATMKVRQLLAGIHRFVKGIDPFQHASMEILDFFRRSNKMNSL
jgi:hypothetical protein